MERYQEAKEKAIKYIRAADHTLTQTYPHIKDPKLLLAVLKNTYDSMDETMSAILQYHKFNKRIPAFHDSFATKIGVIQTLPVPEKGSISKEHLLFLRNLFDVVNSHQQSSMEFARKDAFVISSDNYNLKTITADSLKNYIKMAKSLITEMERIVSEND